MKIAIIGTGISGLGAAFLLHQKHDIKVYEKNSYIGGHSRTIDVQTAAGAIPVDTGFIVYNNENYPHLKAMFEMLGVKTEKSDMSFGASVNNGWLEYGSKNIISQKTNLLRPSFLKMLRDILCFNNKALGYLEDNRNLTLRECLDELHMGPWFKKYYLQAMGAAIWSCSVNTILDFPAKTFIRFFHNHGLLTVNKHPQWYTVSGGSREYINKLTAPFKDKIFLNTGAKNVSYIENKVEIEDSQGNKELFDHVILSCHADQALNMLENPEPYQNVLKHFQYQENKIVVHSDLSFMPKRKSSWASWVYLSEKREDQNESVSLTYWMNNLQNLNCSEQILITLNPGRRPNKNLIRDEHTFTHPVFNLEAINAQNDMSTIQGVNNIWFCGAYQRYGFHEDGLLSAVNVVKKLGEKILWE